MKIYLYIISVWKYIGYIILLWKCIENYFANVNVLDILFWYEDVWDNVLQQKCIGYYFVMKIYSILFFLWTYIGYYFTIKFVVDVILLWKSSGKSFTMKMHWILIYSKWFRYYFGIKRL